MKVSLKKDLNINKSAIRKNVDMFMLENEGDERMEEAMDVSTLLFQRGDRYSVEEALQIIEWYITPHDECVYDNEDDFHPLQVYAANKKIEKHEAAFNFLNNLK